MATGKVHHLFQIHGQVAMTENHRLHLVLFTRTLSTINPAIQWTDQCFSNSACIRYIEKINIQENGQLITLGEHWPVKAYPRQQENTETLQPELKKRPRHVY